MRCAEQEDFHADMQQLQAPIFNIHIHVPPYQGDCGKMYLPKIQPVVHLHFDEVAKNLKLSRKENQDTSATLKKLLSMISPKFGDVKFHFEDSNRTVNKESEKKTFHATNYSDDVSLHLRDISERPGDRCSDNCEVSDCYENYNPSTDDHLNSEKCTFKSSDNREEILKRNFGLKDAVVVLEDVCKTKYYEDMVSRCTTDVAEDSESESGDLSTGDKDFGEENCMGSKEYVTYRIKRENESCSPEQPRKKSREPFCVNPLNSCNRTHRLSANELTGTRNSVSTSPVLAGSVKTVTALVEGCNFSDILSRFQLKKDEDLIEDSVNFFEDTAISDMSCEECCNYESIEGIEGEAASNGLVAEKLNVSQRHRINMNLSQDLQSEIRATDIRISDLDHSYCSRDKYKENAREDTALNLSLEEPDSDSKEISSTSREIITKTGFEIVPSSKGPQNESNVWLPNTRSNKLINLALAGCRLDLMEQEMGRLRRGKSNGERPEDSLKKTASETEASLSKSSSPPKKRRSSEGESRNTTQTKEYIPLQASGPTKFAVAPLNKVEPYKTHDARNFRKEMLFGNRINRFQKADVLQTYLLKQKAAKSQSN